MKLLKHQRGFTIIEIIIVIVILGLLATAALPRFLNTVEEAEDASIDGIAGGFATGVGLVRGQWEVQGRPQGEAASGSTGTSTDLTFVLLDNRRIAVDGTSTEVLGTLTRGYPTGGVDTAADASAVSGTGAALNDSRVAQMTALRCQEVLDLLLQNAPRSISFGTATGQADTLTEIQDAAVQLFVRNNGTVCYYYQTSGLKSLPAAGIEADFNGFSYNPGTGAVAVFKNKS